MTNRLYCVANMWFEIEVVITEVVNGQCIWCRVWALEERELRYFDIVDGRLRCVRQRPGDFPWARNGDDPRLDAREDRVDSIGDLILGLFGLVLHGIDNIIDASSEYDVVTVAVEVLMSVFRGRSYERRRKE